MFLYSEVINSYVFMKIKYIIVQNKAGRSISNPVQFTKVDYAD